ncbi:hypothetical protein B0O80DRAFT_21275 [Mortierella sp. GBAus27b]|nr:hypothetical protein B0O80DRAFT_21275 [Mortierella sp. GBAus27b]
MGGTAVLEGTIGEEGREGAFLCSDMWTSWRRGERRKERTERREQRHYMSGSVQCTFATFISSFSPRLCLSFSPSFIHSHSSSTHSHSHLHFTHRRRPTQHVLPSLLALCINLGPSITFFARAHSHSLLALIHTRLPLLHYTISHSHPIIISTTTPVCWPLLLLNPTPAFLLLITSHLQSFTPSSHPYTLLLSSSSDVLLVFLILTEYYHDNRTPLFVALGMQLAFMQALNLA